MVRSIGSFGRLVEELEDGPELEFEFFGETFKVSDRIGVMPFMKLAHASTVQLSEGQEMAAMYEMLRDIVTDDADWARFQAVAVRNRVTYGEVEALVKAVYEAFQDGRTEKPSSSSPGRPAPTSTKSSTQSQGSASQDSGLAKKSLATTRPLVTG